MSWRLISFFRFSGDVRMPGERTLLNNSVGESDAPTKIVKAYLSNFEFQMLYAMANLSFKTIEFFGAFFFQTQMIWERSESDSNQADRFCFFLQ
jgi:hypothetical protein